MTPFPIVSRHELATATGGTHRHSPRHRPERQHDATDEPVAPGQRTGDLPEPGRTAASYRKPVRLF